MYATCVENTRNLFFVRCNDANVCNWYGLVEFFCQLAAVKHGLHCFSRVKPGWVAALPHLCALYMSNILSEIFRLKAT